MRGALCDWSNECARVNGTNECDFRGGMRVLLSPSDFMYV